MGRRREEFEEGRPVEPEEARASGSDPDAVRIHRRRGEDETGDERGAEERSVTGRSDGAGQTEEGRGQAGREDGGASMARRDRTLITVFAVLGVLATLVVVALTVLGSAEWVQFVIALALLVALAVGAYGFVVAPAGANRESGTD